MVTRGRLVVKLGRPRVDELVAGGLGERFDTGRGRVMKEWFALTADRPWEELTGEAYRHARSSGLERR